MKTTSVYFSFHSKYLKMFKHNKHFFYKKETLKEMMLKINIVLLYRTNYLLCSCGFNFYCLHTSNYFILIFIF